MSLVSFAINIDNLCKDNNIVIFFRFLELI